jgi:hypothetical protein
VARIEEQVDVTPLVPRELVQRPREHGRLTQLRELLRFVLVALRAQLSHELRPQRDERVEGRAVQLVDRLVERHL